MSQPLAFGRMVRERRRALDLTQEELAHRVGCAAVTLRKIEAGDLRPSEQIAERLAMALAVPLEERANFVRMARAISPPQPPEPPSITPPVPPALAIGSPDLRGRTVRGYQLAERLGMGGFGAVYRAIQPVIEREVAVKIILPQYADHPSFVRRFEAEAQLIARLEYPHIVPLYDYWREPGAAFLVMRYLRGGALHDRLQRGGLPLDAALALMGQVGGALAAAHQAGIIHRDLKPANVLLDPAGNAYLADFGIAKDVARPVELTFAGAYVGSPAYSSPEQLRAERVTPQSDIYALGLLLFEVLTGAPPFPGPSTALLIEQHLHARVPLLRERVAGLPESLDQIIQQALAKVPSARFPSVAALLAALQPIESALAAPAAVAAPARRAAPATVVLDLSDSETPYKGLRAFGEGDAADFFGREALTQTLLDQLGASADLARFLAVIGPSGSGKSSAVRAGLLPALRQGALPGSEQWYLVELIPGADPHAALSQALLTVAPAGVAYDELHDLLSTDRRGLLRAIRRVLPADPAVELLLVIDQFEELFTLSPLGARTQILDQIVTTVLDERTRCRVVITLRADLLAPALQDIDFGELLKQRSELVLPLTADELERAIVGPARRVGITFEAGLLATIIGEVGGQPGALPLLQHALSELFLRREGRALTRAAYQEIGGVTGALVRTAEARYLGLDPAGQAIAQQIFLRLIALGEGGEDTRRRVRQDELEALGLRGQVERMLTPFGQARLLSFDRDPATRTATIEVAHEALLRSWPRLSGWLAASREALQLQRQLARAAQEWQAAGRDPSFLARGGRLAQFVGRFSAAPLSMGETDPAPHAAVALTAGERAYLQASQEAAAAAIHSEQQRQVRELDHAQQAARAERSAANRLRLLVGGLALFLLVTVGLSLLALSRERTAQDNFRRAEAQRLAAEANRLLAEGGPGDLVALLSLRSLQQEYTPQGDLALSGATGLEYATATLSGHDAVPLDALITPDGKTLISADIAGTLIFWNAASKRELRRFSDPRGGSALAIAPDGATIYTGGRSSGTITAYDFATLKPRWAIDAATGRTLSLDVSPDGRFLLTTSLDQLVHVWDAATGQEIQRWPIDGLSELPPALFLPDSRRVVLAEAKHLTLRAIGSDSIEQQISWDGVGALAMSHDGQFVLAGGGAGIARLYDLSQGREVRQFRGHRDWIGGVAIAPDNRTIATASSDLSVRLWDLQTGALLREYLGHTGNLFTVHYTPDGQELVSTSFDRTFRIWSVPGHRPAPVLDTGGQVIATAVSPDGRMIATGGLGGGVRIWDRATESLIHQLSTQEATVLAFSPDSQQLLGSLGDRTTRLWRVSDGAEIWQTASFPNVPADFGFSPDGQYALVVREASLDLVRAGDSSVVISIPGTDRNDADFSPDGARFAVANGNQGTVAIWNVATGTIQKTLGPAGSAGAYSVAFAPDGRTIATGGTDNLIRLWDVASGEEVGQLRGHSDVPWDLAFSRDGRLLMSGALDNTARIWDLRSMQELRRFSHRGRIYTAAWIPGDQQILTGSVDGTARIWDVDMPTTIATLCGSVQRDLSPTERALYDIPGSTPTCPR